MNKIIAMAEEAGLKDWWDGGNENYNEFIEHLSRFRDLVLEEAAGVCKSCGIGSHKCVDAIRALKGEKP